jgi:hypothetical protein
MSAQSDYIEWKRKRDEVACLFARVLAAGETSHGQRIEEIDASATSAAIAKSIDERVAKLLADTDCTNAVLLLPNVIDLERFTAAVLQLNGKAHWKVTPSMLADPPGGDVVAIAITRDIPGPIGNMLPSEVLAFGTFPGFPVTRQAPVTAMELFVGTPLVLDPKDGKTPSTKANLAHIPIPALSSPIFNNMMKKTGERRKKSLGIGEPPLPPEDMRAKAKVSFVIPLELALKLGCAP